MHEDCPADKLEVPIEDSHERGRTILPSKLWDGLDEYLIDLVAHVSQQLDQDSLILWHCEDLLDLLRRSHDNQRPRATWVDSNYLCGYRAHPHFTQSVLCEAGHTKTLRGECRENLVVSG